MTAHAAGNLAQVFMLAAEQSDKHRALEALRDAPEDVLRAAVPLMGKADVAALLLEFRAVLRNLQDIRPPRQSWDNAATEAHVTAQM